jgi:hypothetical protein
MMPPRDSPATVVRIGRMRELSSNSHRIPTRKRIMGGMGTAWKVLVGVVLLIPMTAYVVGSLVAAADEPRQHDPIIVEQRTASPDKSPSEKPSPRKSPSPSDDDNGGRGGGDDDDDTETITPSPSDLFDDHGGDRDDDDDFDDDNSGKGSDDDDNSGKGSDDD